MGRAMAAPSHSSTCRPIPLIRPHRTTIPVTRSSMSSRVLSGPDQTQCRRAWRWQCLRTGSTCCAVKDASDFLTFDQVFLSTDIVAARSDRSRQLRAGVTQRQESRTIASPRQGVGAASMETKHEFGLSCRPNASAESLRPSSGPTVRYRAGLSDHGGTGA